MRFTDLFPDRKPIIGMVHLLPLPESPDFAGSLEGIYSRALHDATALSDAGVDALIVENFSDEPFWIGEPTAAQLALMAAITALIRQQVSLPVGVNVQFNAWQAEIALAYACRADFVRVEVFVDTVLMAQGTVQPCSAQIRRYRRALGADRVLLLADIQTKYTQNIIPQPLRQSAIDAQNAGADALIVTGAATGQATPLDAVAEAKQAVRLPVLVGSGTHQQNVAEVLSVADGAIVGSSLKEDGDVLKPVSLERSRHFMSAARA
ncbi:MAG: BtpA/SgcQ family protein [Anaerolineae bacterium]|nr:BtpA/SgcQ family protein [Anaerolineae bacterium]